MFSNTSLRISLIVLLVDNKYKLSKTLYLYSRAKTCVTRAKTCVTRAKTCVTRAKTCVTTTTKLVFMRFSQILKKYKKFQEISRIH